MTTYDQVPYTCHAYPQSHPIRLAMVVKLFGLDAPDVRTAKVLELGCGNGGTPKQMAD